MSHQPCTYVESGEDIYKAQSISVGEELKGHVMQVIGSKELTLGHFGPQARGHSSYRSELAICVIIDLRFLFVVVILL